MSEKPESIIIQCSNCKENLVEVWLSAKEPELKSSIRAKCFLCGDYSFRREVFGKFYLGGCTGVKVTDTEIEDRSEYNNERISLQYITVQTSED
jgi:hypothetical protein